MPIWNKWVDEYKLANRSVNKENVAQGLGHIFKWYGCSIHRSRNIIGINKEIKMLNSLKQEVTTHSHNLS